MILASKKMYSYILAEEKKLRSLIATLYNRVDKVVEEFKEDDANYYHSAILNGQDGLVIYASLIKNWPFIVIRDSNKDYESNVSIEYNIAAKQGKFPFSLMVELPGVERPICYSSSSDDRWVSYAGALMSRLNELLVRTQSIEYDKEATHVRSNYNNENTTKYFQLRFQEECDKAENGIPPIVNYIANYWAIIYFIPSINPTFVYNDEQFNLIVNNLLSPKEIEKIRKHKQMLVEQIMSEFREGKKIVYDEMPEADIDSMIVRNGEDSSCFFSSISEEQPKPCTILTMKPKANKKKAESSYDS